MSLWDINGDYDETASSYGAGRGDRQRGRAIADGRGGSRCDARPSRVCRVRRVPFAGAKPDYDWAKSLAVLWDRSAGGLASFPRYSSALKISAVVWNDRTLDQWLKDPQHFVPGNEMNFEGIKNDQQRADAPRGEINVEVLGVVSSSERPFRCGCRSRGEALSSRI